jgi:multiple sugar transport system permease protein
MMKTLQKVGSLQKRDQLRGPEGSSHALKRRYYLRYTSVIPGVLLLLGLSVFPSVYALVVSFQKWTLTDPAGRRFNGLDNYKNIFTNPEFWHTLKITLIFVFLTVLIESLLAYCMALLFFRPMPFHRIMRTLILLPMLTAPIVVGMLARFMLDSQFGIINRFSEIVGLGRHDFLSGLNTAFPVIIFVDIWQWTPFLFLIFLAAMQSVPEELIEAAKLDGASRVEIIKNIFLPLMKYSLIVGMTLRLIDSFRVYDLIYATTRGGPINLTSTMSWSIYDSGFKVLNVGFASAYSWIFLITVLLVSGIFLRQLSKESEEQ